MTNRQVDDMMEDERMRNLTNPWSDMEKCIFFDRFLQHPKDFRKIASFLKNKDTHDCIVFYYSSKQTVPYKAALKEHLMRKKRRGDIVSWEATIQAALSLGATVTAGLNTEKPLLFHLPPDDQTFTTCRFHPLKLELFDSGVSEITYEEPPPKLSRKRKSALATTFTLDPSERKYLRAESALGKRTASYQSDMDNSMSDTKISRSSSPLIVPDTKSSTEQKNDPCKRGSNKWSDGEKAVFFRSLDKIGKKWDVLAECIGTKTGAQVRNFYYDNKKQNGKGKGSEKAAKAAKKATSEESKSPPPQQSVSSASSLTTDQIAMHLAQSNQAGGLPMPVLEKNNATNEGMHGMVSDVNLAATTAWHNNRQFQMALEQHRQQQLSEQQRILEHQQQQQFDRQRLEQLTQQHLMDQQNRQMQQQQQQHLLRMLNQQQQQNEMVGGVPSWLAAQLLQQQHQQQHQQDSLLDLVDVGSLSSNADFQNVALALRQVQQQRQRQLQQAGINPNGEMEQANSDLSILARMADASRSNQQNRNMQ